jgi:hypothetical protein
MYGFWGFVLVALSPVLLPVSLLFPFYWVGAYRLVRRTGSWKLHGEHHALWMPRLGKAGAVGGVVCLLALLLPDSLPTVFAAVESGGFLWVAAPIAIDLALVMLFSPDKGAERWKAEQESR